MSLTHGGSFTNLFLTACKAALDLAKIFET
jgi:hypothetical protein